MKSCCVPFCKSLANPKMPKSDSIAFFQFPCNLKRRFQWLQNIQRVDPKTGLHWIPSDFSYVCSRHFTKDQFLVVHKNRRLVPDAVPTVFPDYPVCFLKSVDEGKKFKLAFRPQRRKSKQESNKNYCNTGPLIIKDIKNKFEDDSKYDQCVVKNVIKGRDIDASEMNCQNFEIECLDAAIRDHRFGYKCNNSADCNNYSCDMSYSEKNSSSDKDAIDLLGNYDHVNEFVSSVECSLPPCARDSDEEFSTGDLLLAAEARIQLLQQKVKHLEMENEKLQTENKSLAKMLHARI